VSHDLREPLRAISIFSELLQRRHSEAFVGEACEYLNYLTTAAQRMDALVRALRTYTSQADVRAMEVPFTDAGAAAAEAVVNLDSLIREHHADIEVAELPTVRMHHHHMVQLFQNLLANGIIYHRPGAPPHVSVSAVEYPAAWEFLIQDDGIGIAPEYHERIFGIFKRLHTAHEFPGTGVGLAMCKRIVEMNGGAIRVTSAAGVGSTFHITVPKQQADATAQRTA
jgi:light-regulated signal transduction histidine kinase (bacteriophytochrome)